MEGNIDLWAAIKRIRKKDKRFKEEFYFFLMESLEYTLSGLGERRHVTATELLDGLIDYARQEFGMLAYTVLESWGVRSTSEIGTAVFQLVEAGLMAKRAGDKQEDFDNAFDLKTRLEEQYFD